MTEKEVTPRSQELIWRPDAENRWRLFRNNDKELAPRKTEEEIKKEVDQKKEKDAANPFYTIKEKKETKGSLIYTAKGYGIIQNVKPETNQVSVRIGGVVEDFSRDEVTNEIPVTLTFYTKGTRRDETAIFSIHSTAKEILEKIEEGEARDGSGATCQIFWKGKELPKTNENLEKLGFTPLCKLLITTAMGKFSMVSRFNQKYNGWYYSSSSIDGITFYTDKDIRVAGFGMYVPENETVSGTVKFCEGEDCNAGELTSGEVTLNKDMEEEPDTKIWKFKFDKPIRCRAGQKYTCVVMLKNGNTWYGSDGQTTVVGEKDVTFTFQHSNGSMNGTSTGSGQVPTIYYYA